jgi:4-amino-4-deoxy-L-arabinose transferase
LDDSSPAHAIASRRSLHAALLALILIGSFLLKLNHLGHLALKGLDESFHALVARNLLKHPLTPTLIDQPALPYDYRSWQTNHVWLHKPIVPLWQIAASFALFGVSTLALRLPSAILATAATGLTYLIARELLDRRAALIAAALQALNPALVALVQGYIFSDHVDVAFLFWTELSVWLLIRAIRTGAMRDVILAGAAQGIAFLCKTYPAAIVTGIAVVASILPLAGFANPSGRRFKLRRVALLVAATLLMIAPWMIWCAVRFPNEFAWEQLQIFRHLSHDVEGFAAPWDRLVFDYSLNIYHVFYPAVLAAALVLIPRAWRERNFKLALIYAWGFGVLIPHLLATSKTPTATLIGWPPFLMLLAELITRALPADARRVDARGGDALCLGAWAGATIVGAVNFHRIAPSGFGYPVPPVFGTIMRQNIWVLWHLLAALAAAAIVTAAWRNSMCRGRRILTAAAILASLLLAARMGYDGWRITRVNRNHPTFVELGALVRGSLPDNAVLLVDEREKLEYIMVMFFTDRTAYPVKPDNWQALAARVAQAGGMPLLVSQRTLAAPIVLSDPAEGWIVYDAR